jgi:tRNA-binding EMAP/Myf-like protein
LSITVFDDALFPVGVDVEEAVLVLLAVAEDPDASVEEAADVPVAEPAEVVVEAVEAVELAELAEEVVVEDVVVVVKVIPQTAKASNVNGMFLASQSDCWRAMESGYRAIVD